MTLGFDSDLFMRRAVATEFALAFSLLWTPMVRRIAAIMLITMFVSAVFAFGKIDLIGHSLIVVALVGIALDDAGESAEVRDCALMPIGYLASLALFLGIYYAVHAELFGTTIL